MHAADRARVQAALQHHENELRAEFHALSEGLRTFASSPPGTHRVAALLPYVAFAGLGLLLLRRVRRRSLVARLLVPAAIEAWRAWSSAPRAPLPALPSSRYQEND